MNRLKVALIAAAVSVGTLAAGIASAQFEKPDDAVRYRKAAYQVMATHFSRMGAQVRGTVPFNAATMQANMALVEAVHKLPFDAFPAGSDGGGSKAKPEVWSKAAEFKQGQDKLAENVSKLSAAVKTGSMDQIRPAFGAVGQSCKACHDNFKRD